MQFCSYYFINLCLSVQYNGISKLKMRLVLGFCMTSITLGLWFTPTYEPGNVKSKGVIGDNLLYQLHIWKT